MPAWLTLAIYQLRVLLCGVSPLVWPESPLLKTKWASPTSYGITSDLLQEVLPIDELVNTFTIRHVTNVAERLERELADV